MSLTTVYHWDFGDGYTSNEEIPTHKWAREGVYTVTLTVSTEIASATVSEDVTVIAPTEVEISELALRLAIEKAHGMGWSECNGAGWVVPKADYGVLGMVDDNDVFRMLIEDENDDIIWEEATFDAVAFQNASYVDKYYEDSIRNSGWKWVLSASGTAEYYLDKIDDGNPYLDEPKKVTSNSVEAAKGTLGSLAQDEWAYGDNDALGHDTIYIRLSGDEDPDVKDADYIMGFWWNEIPTEVHYKEDVADPRRQQDKLEVLESHIFTRPQEPGNKGNDNYDSNGYRTAQQFNLEVNTDGNLDTPFATVKDIPENGDIVFHGEKVEARRLQFVFKSAASAFQVVGRRHEIVAKPKQGSRTERESESNLAQSAFANFRYRVSRSMFMPLLNRYSGLEIDGNVTQLTGPDGFANSAIQLDSALALLNNTVTGTYTFLVWAYTGAPAISIPGLPALTKYGETFQSWELYYVVGTNCPANLTINQGSVFDITILPSDVTSYLDDYYNDVTTNNEPKIFLPGM